MIKIFYAVLRKEYREGTKLEEALASLEATGVENINLDKAKKYGLVSGTFRDPKVEENAKALSCVDIAEKTT
jgi:hypothetical protein